jgi:small subunit ribosomal protein S16
VLGAKFSVPGDPWLIHETKVNKGEEKRVVKIRLQKLGRRNRAFFRIVVTDARVKRQGMYLEKLGQYDPIETVKEKQLVVNAERLKHWVGLGAQATEAVINLLKPHGLNLSINPAKPKAKKAKKAAVK